MAITATAKAAMQKGRVEKAKQKKDKKEAARARVRPFHSPSLISLSSPSILYTMLIPFL